jgi:hypothetical protein
MGYQGYGHGQAVYNPTWHNAISLLLSPVQATNLDLTTGTAEGSVLCLTLSGGCNTLASVSRDPSNPVLVLYDSGQDCCPIWP